VLELNAVYGSKLTSSFGLRKKAETLGQEQCADVAKSRGNTFEVEKELRKTVSKTRGEGFRSIKGQEATLRLGTKRGQRTDMRTARSGG